MKKVLALIALAALPFALTGCTLNGHFGAPQYIDYSTGAIATQDASTSGWSRFAMNSNVGYYEPYGLRSTSGATKWDGRDVDKVKCFIRRAIDFDPCYRGLAIASQPGPQTSELAVLTTDTSGDGWVSADLDAAAGIVAGVGYLPYDGSVPYSALWQDSSTYFVPNMVDFSIGLTDIAGSGQAYGTQIVQMSPGGLNGTWDQLPWHVRADIINSVNTQTDVRRDAAGREIVTLQLTEVSLWGQVYRPTNLRIDVEHMSLTTIDRNDPDLRLLAAWAADQFEEAVHRGEQAVDFTVTINDAVTVDDALLASAVSFKLPVAPGTVSGLRAWAVGEQVVGDEMRRIRTGRIGAPSHNGLSPLAGGDLSPRGIPGR